LYEPQRSILLSKTDELASKWSLTLHAGAIAAVTQFGCEETGFRAPPKIGRAFLPTRTSPLAAKLAVAGMFLAAYALLEWVSFIHEHKGVPVTPWNPGLGVVFALMVFVGLWGSFVLFIGVITAEFFVLESKLEWPIVIGVGVITSSSYTFVAAVARRRWRLDVGLVHLRDVLVLLAVSLAGAAINTVLLVKFLLAFGPLDSRDVVWAAAPLLVGDIIGIAVMTPLLLRFAFRRRDIVPRRLLSLAPEGVLYAVMISAALWAIVGSERIAGSESLHGSRLFYLLFVPVVVAAVRHGLDGACLSLAVTQFGLIGLLHLSGYNARLFTEFQMLMLVLTATGLIVGVVVSERRNSDRLAGEAEKRLKEKEVGAAQAARFNLVSGMASALAHEINQPMTAARALARSAQHILRTSGGDLTRADGNLTTMIAHIDHAAGVVRHMRDFLRRGRPHVSTVDPRSMLEEALALVRGEASAKRVHIELEASDDLPAIHGDRIQLEQVVLNLVRNAIEAITGAGQSQGTIHVVARRLASPPRVEIDVRDNGPGVDDQLARHLFDPLATSKEEGLGLGLPICVSIIESHGGRIWLHSRDAGSTEFRFSLPLDQPDWS
jgi:two-component system, LuxR family, sensor kinase FixL